MIVQSWHIPMTEEVAFSEVKECLLRKGLISIVDEAEKTFHRYTEPLGIPVSFPAIDRSMSYLLSTLDGDTLCYIEFATERLLVDQRPEERQCLNLIIASKDESAPPQLLADCESVLVGQQAIKGTLQETQLAKSLEEQLKEGTHGRLLSNPEFTSSFEVLCNPIMREQLFLFVKTFGDAATSGTMIEDVLPKRSGLKKSDIRRLINNENLFSKQFSIGCNKCGASTLAFSTKEEAEESFSRSISRRCFLCEENTLAVVEAFALKEPLSQGLQGLWLEHLVYQIIQPMSVSSMVGRMMENFELDVVSVTSEKLILFECKDSSLGGNDFLISVVKAQELDADILWIVTTEPLHENVKKDVERRKEQERFEIFITANLADKQSIESDISQKLEQVQNGFLANLLTRESELPYHSHPSLRRRLLRRPPLRRPPTR